MVVASVWSVSLCFAVTLDEYYLRKFGAVSEYSEKTTRLAAVQSGEAALPVSGTPLKHGLQRDWNLLKPTTQKVLAKQLASPVLSGPEQTFISSGGHFRVHYATSGSDAPPLADANQNGIPDWVETVAATFEDVYTGYSTMGYRNAPTFPAGAPYNIYLLDLAPQGYYGYANSDLPASVTDYPNAYTSWIALDNNFTDSIFRPGTYTPLQSLQITAAHEYHHAVQYGYNFYFDIWFAETTSTWLEDELYDGVNQNYAYIPGWFSNSARPLDTAIGSDAVTTGAGYGRWIFNRYLSEKHGSDIIRKIWEKTALIPSPGGSDIPMVPVIESVLSSPPYGGSLGNDFYGFTRRVYSKEWTTHTGDIGMIPGYSPVATYSAYPVDAQQSIPAPSITLPHYSFAFYRFIPTVAVKNLRIDVSTSGGIQTAAFKRSGGVISEITVGSGGSYTVNGFGSLSPAVDEIVLLAVNTTGTDGHTINFTAGESPSYTLSATLFGAGSGTVTSSPQGTDPAGISCTTGTCTTTYPADTSVTLTPTAGIDSLFGNWGADCTGSGVCSVTMTGPRSVFATFNPAPKAKVSVKDFTGIQSAYDDAATGNNSVIKLLEGTQKEDVIFGRDIEVTLDGGYAAAYDVIGSETTISGRVQIRNGRVKVVRLNVK